jgi:prepilin-type N-terminal cleavage/methylation domain-containing protein
MSDRKRPGFTLVELLVVIVIISMLIALLIPAVQKAREAARRAKCINNQHEIGKGMLSYDLVNGHLPGVINGFGSVTVGTTWPLSWVTVLLPNLGMESNWNTWVVAFQNSASPPFTGTIPLMICPSTESLSAGLNYVVNCGSADTTPAFIGSNGFQTVNAPLAGTILDYYNPPLNAAGTATTVMPRMTSSNIKDGASQTLMLSENLQTGNWMGGLGNTAVPPNNYVPWSPAANGVAYNYVGMFWSATPGVMPATSGSGSAKGTPPNPLPINVDLANTFGSPQSVTDYSHARPSSNHPGVVVVTYCDGHQGTLADDLSYGVYQKLMAPDDAGAWTLIGQPVPSAPLPTE